MAKIVKTVLGGLLTVVLLVAIFIEVKIFWNMYTRNRNQAIETMQEVAAQIGKDKVQLKVLYRYETAPAPDKSGDVLAVADSTSNVRVNGILSSTEPDFNGTYTYTPKEEQSTHRVTVTKKVGYGNDYTTAYSTWLEGNPTAMANLVGISDVDIDNCYQQNYADGAVPFFIDVTNNKYYLITDLGTSDCLIVTSDMPIELTRDLVTAHFGDPTKNPQLHHTYSDYELWAANNTLAELKDGKKDDDEDTKDEYKNTETSEQNNYVSTIDNDKRKLMADAALLKYDEDGHCSSSSGYTLDLTGTEAKKSQWVLTSTSYSYTYAGLTLSTLSGRRSSTEFAVSFNVNNNVDAERPYVIIVKYLSEEGKLLGFKVADKRTEPLPAKGVSNVTVTLLSTDIPSTNELTDVKALQFDIY